MNSTQRLLLFAGLFAFVNLSFIPLLSLYGLRVCPILTIPGFGFGCYYTSIYIISVNVINFLIIFTLRNRKINTPLEKFFKNKFLALTTIYLIATAISLIFLQFALTENHLSTRSRAPQILFFASLLLGILQAYGMEWAEFKFTTASTAEKIGFQKLWRNHIFRIMFPIMIVASILFHFVLTQSESLTNGHTPPPANHDTFILQVAYVIFFLLAWVTITLSFHFLSEKKQVARIGEHFKHLENSNYDYSSSTESAWGLWVAILDQLNSFSKILGEKNRLVKSFSKFVTKDVVQQALNTELKQVNGVNRELTVLMTDIRNFTSISEKLSPEQVVTLLNEYFAVMLNVTTEHHITVDKFIGDGVLAYVDNPTHSDANDDNITAVDTALAMLRSLENLNAKLSLQGLPKIKIGIGVFRGPLVIGLIGSDAKLQHTIIGDTVNRAARLEGLCKELGVPIVISDQVWQSLTADKKSLFTSFGQISVKGIKDSIEVFGGPREPQADQITLKTNG